MGTRGPAPKRESQRRRRNKSETEVEHADAAPVEAAAQPPADPAWHPVAAQWYASLALSGQSKFYEPSDWATACVIAETVSRELSPKPIGVHPVTGRTVMAKVPPSGSSIAAFLKACAVLLATEGDRRRAALELDRPKTPATPNGGADNVTPLDPWRKRLAN